MVQPSCGSIPQTHSSIYMFLPRSDVHYNGGLSDFAVGCPGTSHCPTVLWDPMGHPTSPRSGICLVSFVHPIPLSHGTLESHGASFLTALLLCMYVCYLEMGGGT